MAFLGDESMAAAAASECANEQGRFWEYHDALFAHTAGRGRGVFIRPKLEQYAADLGLDRATFNTCVESGRYDDWVRAETERGRAAGVTGTPTLLINGRRVAQVPDFDQLRSLIASAITP